MLHEVHSGTGYIDVMAVFGQSRRHLVELKVLTRSRVTGLRQPGRYLRTEGLAEGWLVIFDAREPGRRQELSDDRISVDDIVVHRLIADISPVAPSSLD